MHAQFAVNIIGAFSVTDRGRDKGERTTTEQAIVQAFDQVWPGHVMRPKGWDKQLCLQERGRHPIIIDQMG